MIFSQLWGKITGKDKGLKYPDQQASFISRVGDHTIIFPYGLYCDLPDDVLLKAIDEGSAISVTVARPSDAATGEPVVFHPVTNSRVIMRNNGDIDVYSSSKVNIDTPLVNMTGDLRVEGDITARYNTGNDVGLGTHTHSQGNDSNGDAEQETNSATAGT